MAETKEHPSGFRIVLVVFKHLFNGCGSTKSRKLLALSIALTIGQKENNLSSSLMVGLVCYNFLH